MKNIKFKIVALLASLVISLSSCSDFFELDYPASDLPEWQTVGDIEYMVSSCYDFLFSYGSWENNAIGCYLAYEAAVTDCSLINPYIEQAVFAAHTRENYPCDAGETTPEIFLGSVYPAIRSANTVFEFIEKINAGEIALLSVLSDSEKTQLARIEGDCYFMRAFAYWMATQVFMPPYSDGNKDTIYLPLVTESYYTADELFSPYMGTMGEVHEQMLEDFQKAKDLLTEAGTSDSDIQSRVGLANKYAAAAMLMRVKFVMGDWSGALTECEYIVNSGLYNLDEQPIKAFNRSAASPSQWQYSTDAIFNATYDGLGSLSDEPWTLGRLTKIGHANDAQVANVDISGVQTDENWLLGGRGGNWKHKALSAITWNPQVVKKIGWTDAIESDGLSFTLNDTAAEDLRCTQLHSYLLPYVYGGDETLTEQQWTASTWSAMWNDKYLRGANVAATYIPMIRYAEVLLTQASCALAAGDSATALSAINTVRKRASMYTFDDDASTEYTPLTSVTEDEIEIERIKELAFEGNDRLRYLSARKLAIPANGKWKSITGSFTTTVVPDVAYPYDGFHLYLAAEEYDYSSTSGQVGY